MNSAVIALFVVFGLPILLGVLYGLLLRVGYDPVGVLPSDEEYAHEPHRASESIEVTTAKELLEENDEH